MEPFENWVQSVEHGCVKTWSKHLLKLGASFQSFQDETIVDDLVKGGIPLLASRDICNTVKKKVSESHAPMAIFWDLETMPPIGMNNEHPITNQLMTTLRQNYSEKIKSVLKPYGNLGLFRVYARMDNNQEVVTQELRSDLQLSGCQLVDCLNKASAEKMIIIDAMDFAFQNKGEFFMDMLDDSMCQIISFSYQKLLYCCAIDKGATLCFITGDVDYSYLLHHLKKNQLLKTISIESFKTHSRNRMNSHVILSWETDIFELQLSSMPPPGFNKQNILIKRGLDNSSLSSSSSADLNQMKVSDKSDAKNKDNLLKSVMNTVEKSTCGGALKSSVGRMIQTMSPAYFHDYQVVQDFLKHCIDTGALIEVVRDKSELLYLPGQQLVRTIKSITDSAVVNISVSQKVSLKREDMPQRIFDHAKNIPFILFVRWENCPKGFKLMGASKPLIQNFDKGLLFMFKTLEKSQSCVSQNRWLQSGKLIDWRTMSESSPNPNIPEQKKCAKCGGFFFKTKMIHSPETDRYYSEDCFFKSPLWTQEKKNQAVSAVVEALLMLEKYDDVSVSEGVLRKLLCSQWPVECATKADAGLWIREAAENNKVVQFKPPGSKKNTHVCLPHLSKYLLMQINLSEQTIETSMEEDYVVDLLWSKKGAMDRLEVISSLKMKFKENMDCPLMRNRVFHNAAKNEKFRIARGVSGHAVGLKYEDALEFLEP